MQRRKLFFVLAFVLSGSAGCAECDAALEKVCACPGVDCDADDVPRIVDVLRSCDQDAILGDGYNLPVCIEGSDSYCAALTGLAAEDASVCTQDCTDTCDLQGSCSDFQYASCDLPPQGGAQ